MLESNVRALMLELNGRAVRRVLESNVEQQGKAVEPLSANEPSESPPSLNRVSSESQPSLSWHILATTAVRQFEMSAVSVCHT